MFCLYGPDMWEVWFRSTSTGDMYQLLVRKGKAVGRLVGYTFDTSLGVVYSQLRWLWGVYAPIAFVNVSKRENVCAAVISFKVNLAIVFTISHIIVFSQFLALSACVFVVSNTPLRKYLSAIKVTSSRMSGHLTSLVEICVEIKCSFYETRFVVVPHLCKRGYICQRFYTFHALRIQIRVISYFAENI